MSSPEKPSVADLLRKHIENQIKMNYDYSTATTRKEDVNIFIKKNSERFTEKDFGSIRSNHNTILTIITNKQGKDPKDLGKQGKGKTKLKFNSDMNKSNIEAKPQAGKNDTSKTNQDPNSLTQPMPAQMIQAYSVEAVSATFSALFLTIKVAFPDLEQLTDDEKKTLGEMWQPAFNLYLQNEKLAVIGIPILSTLGLFIPKILEARKVKRIRNSKDEGLLRQKEIDLKNELQQKELQQKKDNPNQPKQDPSKPEIGSASSEIKSGVLPKND